MGHKNKKSLVKQVEETLTAKMAAGRSKHADKRTEAGISEHIYSYETLRGYIKQSCYFAKWCKVQHMAKDLQECRQYVNEFLQDNIDKGLSAYTIKLRAAALAKLYGCSTTDFIPTPARKRCNITRSRGERVRDKHVSLKKNAEIIAFCRSTGLRRRELQALTGDSLIYINGKPYIHVRNGKGGRERNAPIIDHLDEITALMRRRGALKVFDSIPGALDVHGYRSEYATAIYRQYARPLDTLNHAQKYFCRGDQRGRVYDRRAMLITSKALGHNRINVIAGHYLR